MKEVEAVLRKEASSLWVAGASLTPARLADGSSFAAHAACTALRVDAVSSRKSCANAYELTPVLVGGVSETRTRWAGTQGVMVPRVPESHRVQQDVEGGTVELATALSPEEWEQEAPAHWREMALVGKWRLRCAPPGAARRPCHIPRSPRRPSAPALRLLTSCVLRG